MSMEAVNHHDACVDVMVEPETVEKHGWGRKTCPLRVREGALTWTKGWVLTEKQGRNSRFRPILVNVVNCQFLD